MSWAYTELRPAYTGAANYPVTITIPGSGTIAGQTFSAEMVKSDGTSAGAATAVVSDGPNRKVLLTLPGQSVAQDYKWLVKRTDDGSNDLVAEGVIEVSDPRVL